MNPEQIQDALNLLDDAIITPVEKLRSRKKSPPPAWIRWSCAACACIVTACIFTIWKFGLFSFDSTFSDGLCSTDYCDSIASYKILVEIQAWQSDGFSALVMDTPPSPFLSGETITVLFSEYAGDAPSPADFPSGTVVCIQYREQETVDSPETGSEHILYAKIILPNDRY